MIVSRGTTCWEAEDLSTGKACIIKDSWRASWRTSEGDLLALAEKSSVFALPAPVVHGDVLVPCRGRNLVDTIDQVRELLSYDDASQVVIMLIPENDLYSLHSSLPVVPVTIGSNHISSSVTHTRKALSDITKEKTRKRTFQTAIMKENSSGVRPNKVRRIVHSRSASTSGGSKKSNSATSAPRTAQPNTTPITNATDITISRPLGNQQDSGSWFKVRTGGKEKPEEEWTLTLPRVQATDHSSVVDPLCSQRVFNQMTHTVNVSNSAGEEIKYCACVEDLLKGMRDAIKCKYVNTGSGGISD